MSFLDLTVTTRVAKKSRAFGRSLYHFLFYKARMRWAFAPTYLYFLPFVLTLSFSVRALLGAMAVFLWHWSVYLVNDFYDAPYDQFDHEKRRRNLFCQNVDAMQGGTSSHERTIGMVLMGFTIIMSLVFSVLVNSIEFLLLIILGHVVMFLYSAPPVRGKIRFILDWILHVTWALISISLAFFVLEEPLSLLVMFSMGALAATTSLTSEIKQQLRDLDVDRITGQHTTAILLGTRTTITIMHVSKTLSIVAILAILHAFQLWIALAVVVISMPFQLREIAPPILKNASQKRNTWYYYYLLWFTIAFLEKVAITFVAVPHS